MNKDEKSGAKSIEEYVKYVNEEGKKSPFWKEKHETSQK